MSDSVRRCLTVTLLLGAALDAAGASAATLDGAALIERYAPTVVSLRVTVKTEMEGSGGPGEDSSEEVRGALVDPSGLILCWNSHFSAGRMAELFSGFGASPMRVKVTPTDIRVTLPGETQERRAFLAASDSDLDLAFVQIEEWPEKPLPAVDFSHAAAVQVGDEIRTVGRLSSAFDHAPFFDRVQITGEVRKPRAAWIVGGGNATQVGLPYFSADGLPAGVLVTMLSRSGAATTPNPSKLFAELVSLGRGDSEVGPLGLFLLPAERIQSVIAQAKERAAELLAERGPAAAVP